MVIDDIVNLLVLQRNGAAAPFIYSSYYKRIYVWLESTHQETVVLVNQGEPPVLEEALIEQKEPSSEPRAGFEQRAFVDALVGNLDGDYRLIRDIVNEVQLRAGLVVVGGLELREKTIQLEDGYIGDHHAPKSLESWGNVVGDSDFLDGMVEEVAEGEPTGR